MHCKGWDTTLAHRRLVTPLDSISTHEMILLRDHSGIWIDDESVDHLNRYLDEWNDSLLSYCDLVGVFPATTGRMSEYCHLGLGTKAVERGWRRCDTGDARMLGGITQLVNEDTWMEELRGLRVLVIHPFASTIATQYEKHVRLISQGVVGGIFGENHVNALPVFKQLVTLVPPIGSSDGSDWRAQLETFQERLMPLASEFDVALIGAGGFGPLLNRFISQQLGFSSIYIGGVLQVHFGILGGGYSDEAQHMINDKWVCPSEEEMARLRHLKD